MLIISRKLGESFLIGGDIKVCVVESSKDKVRLGIEAPKNVKIIRAELYESERFNMQAAVNKAGISFMNSFFSDSPKQLNNVDDNK